MNLIKPFKYLSLLVSASTYQKVRAKNEHGHDYWVPVSRSAFNELKRPPFVPSAPTTKKVWSESEITEFKKNNPVFNV